MKVLHINCHPDNFVRFLEQRVKEINSQLREEINSILREEVTSNFPEVVVKDIKIVKKEGSIHHYILYEVK